eukprot:s625_g22.t1
MPPAKRKSGAGSGEKPGKANKVSTEKLEAYPHVPKVVQWLLTAICFVMFCGLVDAILIKYFLIFEVSSLNWQFRMVECQCKQFQGKFLSVRLHDVVFPAGGPDKYLTQRHTYASKFDGPQLCRPWQLAWRADFGCSGFFEPETACLIVELMFVEGHLGFKLQAVSALMSAIPSKIVTKLEAAVKIRGMQRLLLHEVLSKGIFSQNWTSGFGTAEAWKDELRNRDDGVNLVVDRMLADHDGRAEGLRRALNFRDALLLHQSAGCFLHFLKVMEKSAPSKLFQESKDHLMSQFLSGFMDGDLTHVVTSAVPPGDIKSVASFRLGSLPVLAGGLAIFFKLEFGFGSRDSRVSEPFMSKIETLAESQKQDREAALARNLRKADFEQIMAKITADMDVLEHQVSPEAQKHQEHALDMKYLRERQQGKEYVDKWLSEHCHLRGTTETFDGAIPDFLKWKEQFRQEAGET